MFGDVEAGDDRVAVGRLKDGAEHPQGRRLARAVGSEQTENLAGTTRNSLRRPPRPIRDGSRETISEGF